MRVVFSELAREDLRDIALYIGRDDKRRAHSFVLELRACAHAIAAAPRAFPVVPRYQASDLRVRVFRDYLIFYRIDDVVVIVRIRHGAQDYPDLSFVIP